MKPRYEMKAWMMASGIMASALVRGQDSAIHMFTAQQAAEYAMKNNVQVKNALLDIQLQEQTNRDLTSAAYPQLNANGSFTYNAKIPVSLVPGDFFGQPGTFIPVQFGVRYNAIGGITLDQLLFDGQVFVGLQARQTAIDFRAKNAEVTQEMIKANIYKIYYQLIASKTQIQLLDANITRLDKLLHDTREIYKNGFAEKLDVDRISVQMANVQSEKVRVLNQVNNGYLGLKLLIGMPMTDSLVLTEEVTYDRVKQGLLDGSTFNYTDRKEYQYTELGIKLNEYNIKRYKLSKYPTLRLGAFYNTIAQQNEFTYFKDTPGKIWYPSSALTLSVNVPIFHGFSTNAKIASAKLDLQKSVNERENLKLQIQNEVETAKNNFQTAITTLDFQKQNMELAENVYNQTKKKYEAGTGDQIEIINAETDLRGAQTNYIAAMYAAIIAKVDYLKAIGKF
jgi:outer membrane protein